MLSDNIESSENLKVTLNANNRKRKADGELSDNVSEIILQNLRKQKGNKLNKETLRRIVFNFSGGNSTISAEEHTIQINEQFEDALNLLQSEDLVVDTGAYIKLKSSEVYGEPESGDELDLIGNKTYASLHEHEQLSDSDDEDEEDNNHIFIHNHSNQNFASNPASLPNDNSDSLSGKSIRYSQPWTDEMDAKLRAAHDMYSNNWVKIADYIGTHKTAVQCCSRWRTYANPKYEGYKLGPWSTEEEQLMMTLVPIHRKSPVKGKSFINWIEISAQMNRSELECGKKYESMRNKDCIRGHYTPEEDAAILGALLHLPPGAEHERALTQVAQDINRLRKTVKTRFNVLRNAQRVGGGNGVRSGLQVFFTPEMDQRLSDAVTIHGPKKWAQVADHVGHGISANSCKMRWVRNVNPDIASRKSSAWTEEELAQLPILVHAHQRQRGGSICTDWTSVANALNRKYNECEKKWRSIAVSQLKHGKYTPEEDAVIRHRVAEWGDRGRGMWMSIEKELGRSAANIQSRYAQVLSVCDGPVKII